MLIAQISDLHARPKGKLCYGRVDTNERLEKLVQAILRLDRAPDCVLATGDLTDNGLPEEYDVLRETLSALDMPVYLVPGNHDRRENLRAAFGDHGYFPAAPDGEFLHFVVDDYPVRLVGLDTVQPGSGAGEFCEARADWLRRTLMDQPERPTMLFMHHPPFRTGLGPMDKIMCLDEGRMAGVVRDFPNVVRVLCGHHHRPIQALWAGALASCSPAPAHQVALELDSLDDAKFIMEPAAYQLHLWAAEGEEDGQGGGFVSHTAYVDAYDGPHPFTLEPDYPGAVRK